MTTDASQFNYANYMYKVPLFLVFVMWFVYWVEIRFDFNFTNLGVYPRTWKGLMGIFTSPFIHGGTKHLFNNSIPVFVLLFALFYFYEAIAFKVLLWGALFTGIGTWVIGKQAYHIGMSGVVYLLFGFVFFKISLQTSTTSFEILRKLLNEPKVICLFNLTGGSSNFLSNSKPE